MNYLSKSALLIALVSPFSNANTLFDELSICAKNTDSLQRLVCYDKLVKGAVDSRPNQKKAKQKVEQRFISTICHSLSVYFVYFVSLCGDGYFNVVVWRRTQ